MQLSTSVHAQVCNWQSPVREKGAGCEGSAEHPYVHQAVAQRPCNPLSAKVHPCVHQAVAQRPCNPLSAKVHPYVHQAVAQRPCNPLSVKGHPYVHQAVAQRPCNPLSAKVHPYVHQAVAERPCNPLSAKVHPKVLREASAMQSVLHPLRRRHDCESRVLSNLDVWSLWQCKGNLGLPPPMS